MEKKRYAEEPSVAALKLNRQLGPRSTDWFATLGKAAADDSTDQRTYLLRRGHRQAYPSAFL
ncbi:MAG: hypothetical protein ACRYG5_11215 [Janthinobacterium lividum]